MASFGAEATAIPTIGTSSQPQGGVRHVQEQKPVFWEAVDNLFQKTSKTLIDKNTNKVLADFTEKQLALIQAVDQGMPSQFARTQIRKNFIEYVNNHPRLREDLIQTNAALLGTAGMGSIVTDGTVEERRRESLRNGLVSNGLVGANATEAEFIKAEDNYTKAAAAEQTYAETMRRLNLEQTTLQMDAAKKKDAVSQATFEFVTKTTPMYQDQFESTVTNLVEAEGSTEEKLKALDTYWLELTKTTQPYMMQMDESDRKAIMAPFEMMKDRASKLITGEYDTAAYDSEITKIKKLNELIMMRDPAISRVVAISSVAPNILTDATLTAESARAVANFLDANSNAETSDTANLFKDDSTGVNAVNAYTSGIANADTSDPKVAQEVATNLASIFDGVTDYAGVIKRDPKKAIALSDWMATEEFWKLTQAHPELLENKDTAQQVLEQNLYSEVFAMVKREFNSAKVVDYRQMEENLGPLTGPVGKEIPTDSLVTWRPTSEGMEFVAIDGENKMAVKEARRLNSELKPIINKSVKAFSHLSGNQDYTKTFESIADTLLFGESTSGSMSDKDAGDDLQLSDFQKKLEAAGSDGVVIGSVSEAGAGYTVVVNAEGVKEKRTGSRAWRNNNPGNIEYGNFAKSQGAVGSDGRFAVFTTYEEGRKAKENLLFESSAYSGKTISTAIAKYAPAFENDTASYAANIASAAGVSVDTPLADLSQDQRVKLLNAMEQVEGFKIGKTQVLGE